MEAVIISAGVGFISVVGAYLTAKSTQRKLNAEGTAILVQTAIDLNAPLRSRVEELETEVVQLKAQMIVDQEQIIELKVGVNLLLNQIEETPGLDPAWTPTDV